MCCSQRPHGHALRWNHKSCGAQCTAAVPGAAAGDGGSDGSGFYSFSSTKAKSQKTMEHPTLVLHLLNVIELY